MSQRVVIFHHGNCFDGILSAAIFSRFYLQKIDPSATLAYRSMSHSREDPYGPDHDQTLNGDVNVVVDFRYSPSARLNWWCDHHQSSFLQPEHAAHFLAHPNPQHCFEPAAPSCAGLLNRWLQEAHGFEDGFFSDHVLWADRIDSARFANPQEAVELPHPALQLMALLESGPGKPLVKRVIERLSQTSVDEVHADPKIQKALQPVLERHRRQLGLFQQHMTVSQGVAYVDLTNTPLEGFNKFVPYYYDPEVRYTVVVTTSPRRAKVSVGSNPWNRPDPLINIAQICERYGGGGHPVVGAVTYRADEVDKAREASIEIATLLRES